MDLMLGLDNFGSAITKKVNFVDKSLFIKAILDDAAVDVPVIVRPRRFGKTFNLSMLHHFLAAEVNGLATQKLFDGLKITQAGETYVQEQGKYPVVFITFKDIKGSQYEEVYDDLSNLIVETYRQHSHLLSSTKLSNDDKDFYRKILKKPPKSKAVLKKALKELTRLLFQHHGVKPWILIDEYDTPIQAAYVHGYYPPIMELMRSLLGAALKGNPYLHRAVVTGILRIAKENLFSGINNLKVYSVLDSRYSEYFGFTEMEVDDALTQAGLKHLSAEIKAWYNGYQIGDHQIGSHQIYNPWSIANCIHEQGKMKPYWVNTSDNALIKKLLAQADAEIKTQFESILAGQAVETMIDENMVFSDLEKKEALWSLLLFSGYLTCIEMQLEYTKYQCKLRFPNQEVIALYKDIVCEWFTDSMGTNTYQALLVSLTEARLDDFLFILQKFLLESASYFDVKGTEPEKFYHGFVMGLIVSLSDTHIIQSNKESGYGRYDVVIIPKNPQKLGLILEFKVARPNKTLTETAEEALTQLRERRYETILQQKGIANILQIGLAFHGKEVELIAHRLSNDASL